MTDVLIPNGWDPRPYQLPAWMAWRRGTKRSLLIWHRRAGKDDVALHKAAVAAHDRVATYWHMLPEYAQARKAIWNAVNPLTGKRRIDEAFPAELIESRNDQEMFIRFKIGSTWQVVGSDRYDSLVGTPPAGVVFSEWALANPAAWGVLAPILAENGGWADFITTPRGRNHVKTMLDMARGDAGWLTEVLTVDDTHAISRDVVEQQRKEYHALYGVDAGDALIEQEYWCSFEAAVHGSYYGREMLAAERQGRIGVVPIDPNAPVHTAWDLGVGDTMVIWFWQAIGPQIRVVGYYASSGYGIDHYAAEVRRRAATGGYERGTDHVPHDARQRSMTSWGEDGTAKQRLEVMIECGLRPEVVPIHKVDDGISAVRRVLPRCFFDQEGTEDGIEALRQYRRDWDDKRKMFHDRPRHDWASHPADAFRTLAMAWQAVTSTTGPAPPVLPTEVQPLILPDFMSFTPPEERRI